MMRCRINPIAQRRLPMADQDNQQSNESSSSSSENIQIPPISKEAAGAAAGAVVGSVAGPVGAGIGGVVGAAGGRRAASQSTAPVEKAAQAVSKKTPQPGKTAGKAS